MGLFTRVRDILSANFSEMAERFEDPEKMLKQAIREMEDSIRKATEETVSALATEKKLARELEHNEREAASWTRRAERAVAEGDDDLARRALGRKRDYERIAIALRDQTAAAGSSSETLRLQLDGMRGKLAEAKRNLASLSARKKAADVRKKVYAQMGETPEIGVENAAFEKFERLRDRVEQAEAEAEAMAEIQGVTLDSPDVPAVDSAIEDELLELKRRKSSGAAD